MATVETATISVPLKGRASQDLDAQALDQLTLTELERYLTDNTDGVRLTIEHIARLVGVSAQTIRAEIRYGMLRAHKSSARPGRGEWRVKFTEAKRYLTAMGILPAPKRRTA